MPYITTACLNSPMPLRLNALLCQCVSAPLHPIALPKPYCTILLIANALPLHDPAIQCRRPAVLCLAHALLVISPHCPRIPLLCQNHAPLSHGNTLPGPFIAIQCPYFAMPVLTSRCSASAIRFLSLPQRNVTYPRLCLAYLHSAFALLIYAIAVRRCSSLNIALAPLISALLRRF